MSFIAGGGGGGDVKEGKIFSISGSLCRHTSHSVDITVPLPAGRNSLTEKRGKAFSKVF